MNGQAGRLHHLDALRALAMVLILPVHALALIGLRSGWNDAEAATFWTIHLFRLPLFFLLAGFFGALLLESRGTDALLRNRTIRIGVPLVVGVAAIVPVLSLLLRAASSSPDPALPAGLPGEIADVKPSYLWFLWYLALLYGGVLVGRHALSGRRVIATVREASARILGSRLAPLLLAVPTALLLYRQPTWMASSTPAESFVPVPDLLAYYAIFFLSGWVLFVTPGLRERIEGRPGHYTVLAAVTLPPALSLYLLQDEPAIGAGRWFHLLALLLLSVATWSIVLGLLGVSRRYLAAHSPRLRLWADASYWIYLSHFVPMAALAAVLLAVQVPETLRFAILVGATLGLVYPAYRAFVRHSAVGRILHGPRPYDSEPRIPGSLTSPAAAAAPRA